MNDALGSELESVAGGLFAAMRSLHLATVDGSGMAEASYAPYVVHDGALFVYLSALAAHVANLRATRSAAILVVADESASEEIFARARFGARCAVVEIPRESESWEQVLDRFEARFGATATMIRPLTDFALFRLQPEEARVVAGFARAGTLDAPRLTRVLAAAC